MLIGGILLGLIAGLVLGGRLDNLADLRLRLLPLLFLAVIVRFATEAALSLDVGLVDLLRLPLFITAYGLLLYGLWANRSFPGLGLAFVGIGLNAAVIAINGGWMPVWAPSLEAAGFDPARVAAESVFHRVLYPPIDATFLLAAGPLTDIIPIPWPEPLRNVASIGDLFLTAGLGFFLFATVMRSSREAQVTVDEERIAQRLGLTGAARLPHERSGRTATGYRITPGTGLGGLGDAAALDRPVVLGSRGVGMTAPSAAAALGATDRALAAEALAGEGLATAPTATAPALPAGIALRRRGAIALLRARRHPYVRLALNPSFSALWAGQLISYFGDRVHLIALLALVYTVTGSALATSLAFFAGTLPNLLLSPIAGAYVDRWDTKQVLIVSDILRAAVVLLIPVAVLINVALVYPLVFAMTTITLFFRPARVAVLPRIVREKDLLPANSALWVGETLADVIGYPLAGLFVAFLATSLPIAFWVDAATYLASALLLATVTVPAARRGRRPGDAAMADDQDAGKADAADSDADADEPETPPTPSGMVADLRAGWAFLRTEPVLLANTIQGALGQFAIGVLGGIAFVYADQVLSGAISPEAAFSFLETAIGVGNLVGGLALGFVGTRLSKGGLVIGGYLLFGVCIVLLGFTSALPLAVGLMVGAGIANMVYVIPSQTLFQERTPDHLIGRVIGFRFAIVFGAMTIAAPIAGVAAEFFGAAAVIAVAGVLSLVAGFGGLATRAVRDA